MPPKLSCKYSNLIKGDFFSERFYKKKKRNSFPNTNLYLE